MPDFKHITLTGIDDRTDIKELVRLQKRYPLVEFGVLLSWSQQGSERRYPSCSYPRIPRLQPSGICQQDWETHL